MGAMILNTFGKNFKVDQRLVLEIFELSRVDFFDEVLKFWVGH